MQLKISIKTFIINSTFAILSLHSTFANELLHLEFNDSNQLAKQTGAFPLGEIQGDAKPSKDYPGSIEFGPAGGLIRIPAFHSPKGPFTVEARFLIHNYAPESSRFIADILNTATWGGGPTQGFVFRVGGGYLYPPLLRDAYKTEADWSAAQGNYSFIDRGVLANCVAEFTMARMDNSSDWKEVYTNRCIEKDTWTHLVGLWNGTNMRIYLNGTDATDKWRVRGLGAEPRLDSVVEAYIGSRTIGEYDPRHLDGILDYVKVEEGVLSDYEIHKRYQNNFVTQVRDSLCIAIAIPHYPEAGQLCKGKLDLEFKVIMHGGCTDSTFKADLIAGDSVEIEIAKDPSFTDVVHRVSAVTTLHLEANDLASLVGYQGEIYWRARLIHAKHGALAKSSAVLASEWSLSRPLALDMSGVSGIRTMQQIRQSVLVQIQQGLFVAGSAASPEPVLLNLSGKRQLARFQRVAGGWRLDAADRGFSGLFIIEK